MLKPLPEGYFMRIQPYYKTIYGAGTLSVEIRKRTFWKFSEIVVDKIVSKWALQDHYDPEDLLDQHVHEVHEEFWLRYEGNASKQKVERYLDTVMGDYPPKEWKK